MLVHCLRMSTRLGPVAGVSLCLTQGACQLDGRIYLFSKSLYLNGFNAVKSEGVSGHIFDAVVVVQRVGVRRSDLSGYFIVLCGYSTIWSSGCRAKRRKGRALSLYGLVLTTKDDLRQARGQFGVEPQGDQEHHLDGDKGHGPPVDLRRADGGWGDTAQVKEREAEGGREKGGL